MRRKVIPATFGILAFLPLGMMARAEAQTPPAQGQELAPAGNGWQGDAPLSASVYRATISAPSTLPAGSQDQYAWVMADGYGSEINQVGWAWWPWQSEPRVFVFATGPGQSMAQGTWTMGPFFAPGSSVQVQITRDGGTYADQYRFGSGSWVPLAISHLQLGMWTTYMENYGAPMGACFTNRGWEAGDVWHHLQSGCVG